MSMERKFSAGEIETPTGTIDPLTLCGCLSERSPLPLIAVEGLTHLVRYVNPAFCRLAEKTSEDLLGKPLSLAVPEGEENGCLALLDSVYRAGGAESLVDQQHRHATPESCYWSYAVWAILDEAERPAGVMIQVTDTTEQALARQQLALFNQTLLLSGLHQQELTELAETGVQYLQRSLRETNHLAKNNLQIIASLLDMQIMENVEAVSVATLAQLLLHIQTVASFHDLLTYVVQDGPKASVLSVTAILRKLLPMWQRVIGTQGFRWSADDMELPIKKGMSLALLINELVTNAVKHGAQAVELQLIRREDIVTLTVSDDGPGFSPAFDPSVSAHFGLDFVESVTRLELDGKVKYANGPGGARVTVTFPPPILQAALVS